MKLYSVLLSLFQITWENLWKFSQFRWTKSINEKRENGNRDHHDIVTFIDEWPTEWTWNDNNFMSTIDWITIDNEAWFSKVGLQKAISRKTVKLNALNQLINGHQEK